MDENSKQKVLDKQREVFDVIGHELRTPLSIIKVNAGLLKEKEFSEGGENLERIEDALDRASKLLESMLSTAKIEEGKLELNLDKVELISIIRESLTSVQKIAKEKSLDIVLDFAVDELFVYADKLRLQQITDNFINNAVKYTNQGSVKISVVTEGTFARVTVSDTGIGMPQSSIDHLGEKFFRGEDSKNSEEELLVKPGGTGLGLYIAFNLINAMGGSFTVNSEVGKGSSFSFTIPLYNDQQITKVEEEDKRDVFKRVGFTHTDA